MLSILLCSEQPKSLLSSFSNIYFKHLSRTCGVWSVFGEPYNPQGAPDVELLRHAQKCKEERRKRRKTKKKTVDEKKKSKTTFNTTMTWGGNRNKSKKIKKSSTTIASNMPELSRLQRGKILIYACKGQKIQYFS